MCYSFLIISILEEENFSLHQTVHLCGLLLLWRGLPDLQGSVIASSAAVGMASLSMALVSGLLREVDNLTIRNNNWKA
jgi:hypothetical protein